MLAKHHHVDPAAQGTVQERGRHADPADAHHLPHPPQVQPQQRLALMLDDEPSPRLRIRAPGRST